MFWYGTGAYNFYCSGFAVPTTEAFSTKSLSPVIPPLCDEAALPDGFVTATYTLEPSEVQQDRFVLTAGLEKLSATPAANATSSGVANTGIARPPPVSPALPQSTGRSSSIRVGGLTRP